MTAGSVKPIFAESWALQRSAVPPNLEVVITTWATAPNFLTWPGRARRCCRAHFSLDWESNWQL